MLKMFESYISENVSKIEVLLAKNWKEQDVIGWWWSEKLDGVRAYWNGKNLLTRNNNIINAPDWFLKELPNIDLDGELYMGRNTFDKLSGYVRKLKPNDSEWKQIKYMIFDSPDDNSEFEVRMKRYYSACKNSKILIPVEHKKLSSIDELYSILSEVEKNEGEGLMLRKPRSLYERKRSNVLLKVKTFHDMEAEVIGYTKGEGKYSNLIGALICKLENGVEFNLSGMTDEVRKNPPKIGSIVTFKYKEITKNGKPKFAFYVRTYNKI